LSYCILRHYREKNNIACLVPYNALQVTGNADEQVRIFSEMKYEAGVEI
jgi:hypothetical protein